MFNRITLRGPQGAIVWAYKTAATLGAWSVQREREGSGQGQGFELRATIVGACDAFSLRQRPLLFTAPRRGRNAGMFCFPIHQMAIIESTVIATLGPPEN